MRTVTALRLEARKNSNEAWGILNTVNLDEIGNQRAYDRARTELERMATRWHENWDPIMETRIIELSYGKPLAV